MTRQPFTFSDLGKLTRLINESIASFFASKGIKDYPIIDGGSNGWAGNSLYHQHFQFFQSEYNLPFDNKDLGFDQCPLVLHDKLVIHKMHTDSPTYRIMSDNINNLQNAGDHLSYTWRILGEMEAHYKIRKSDDHAVDPDEQILTHTHNLLFPGIDFGKVAYYIPRDKLKIDYIREDSHFVDCNRKIKPISKLNIGFMEMSYRLFFIILNKMANIKNKISIVKPETVLKCKRAIKV